MKRKKRLATRLIKYMSDLPYEERLRRLNLFSLERRYFRGNFILAYDIFHGHLDFPHAECFEAPAERNLRGQDFKIRQRCFRVVRRKAAYSVRLHGPCNSLSEHIVHEQSLSNFKRLLDVAWPSLFHDRPCYPI